MTNNHIDAIHRIHPIRHVFEYAIDHNPSDLYEAMGSPEPDTLARRAILHLTKVGIEEGALTADHFDGARERTLLTNGLRDTHRIVETSLDAAPPTQEEALSAIRHIETARTVALIALRGEGALNSLLLKREGQEDTNDQWFRLADDQSHITMHQNLRGMTRGGCPFAGHGGEAEPDPLFMRFVSWAGELSVHSLYAHKYKKDTL